MKSSYWIFHKALNEKSYPFQQRMGVEAYQGN